MALVDAFPTITTLRDGVIETVDEGVLPSALIERVKQRSPTAPTTSAAVLLAARSSNVPTATSAGADTLRMT
jgi:hypothetical protein